MASLVEKIKSLSNSLAQETVGNRHHLHMHPELSFQETATQAFVEKQLNAWGIATNRLANTGVVAIIEGKNPSKKVVALRADMDALPIIETNDVPYKSQNPGVMHACGHDVHTSSLLGTAHILQTIKDEFEGTVKLIFQPAEEKAPGGASIMIKEGVLENPKPVSIFGQHVATNVPVGKIGFREGMYMASTDELYIKVIGKGGHGAMPDACIDPIVIASHIIVAMQQIISRNKNPKFPSVLTFGKIEGLGATNVIPDEVNIAGTFRAMDETWRAEGLEKMKKLAEGIADAMGGQAIFEVLKGYPFLQNNPELTRKAKAAAIAYMGEENVVDLDLWMAGEDFAFYTHHVDACFYRLGIRNEAKGITSGVHTPSFDIDEDALAIGPGLMAWLAVNELVS
ncbi:M20 metallopeptidase family protein [Aquirufa regiilacus]|uniref:M20 family metallopeptidase n=1 Tax=Aquirufa regiilacus TaxID=3024868 RepID=A0ABU3TUN4_9BACT|nr:M20 family metallopeptidase [Aquirufa sp. LEOWEIH-7C]MDU0809514.1 M20 family metallopeptidase [Aquirufa sp. LEOWEIH-7C]